MIIKNRIIYFVSLAVFVLVLGGCSSGGETFGEVLSDNNVTKITSILQDPKSFLDQMVKVEGQITMECPTGCWFFVKDDTGRIYVDISPAGLAIPQRVGRRVVLEGIVKDHGGTLMIHGKGISIR